MSTHRLSDSDLFSARNAKALDTAQQAALRKQMDLENLMVAADAGYIGMLLREGVQVFYTNWPNYAESLDPRDLLKKEQAA